MFDTRMLKRSFNLLPEIATVIIVTLLITLFYLVEENRTQGIQERVISEEQDVLSEQVISVSQDLQRTLNSLTAMAHIIESDYTDAEKFLSLATLARAHPEYLQLRHISASGTELFRINQADDRLIRVAPDKLQDKSKRHYVEDVLHLLPGDTYISKFELNMEANEIEIPPRPVLRIALRLQDSFVIINLDATEILDRITSHFSERADSWLINGDGDWLIGPDKSLEWGFMLGQTHRIGEYLSADLANEILTEKKPHILKDDAELIIAEHLGHDLDTNGKLYFAEELIFIRHFPPEYITSTLNSSRFISPLILAALLICAAGVLLWLLRLSQRYQRLSDLNQINQQELNRLKELADFLPQLTWTSDAQGHFDFISQTWTTYTGASQKALKGVGWYEFIHPDDRALLMDTWHNCLQSGHDLQCRFRIQSQDGQYRMFDSRARALRAKDGNIIRWFGSSSDIQTSLNYEQALEEEKRQLTHKLETSQQEQLKVLLRLQAATDSAGIGIWEYSPENNLFVWDKRMYQLYGIDKHSATLHYNQWLPFVHPDDVATVESQLAAAIKADATLDIQYRIVRPSGETVWIKAYGVPVPTRPGSIKLVGVNHDVTDVQLLNQQLEKSNHQLQAEADNARKLAEAKSRFLANMSHEIRTPMNGVIGMLDLIRKTSLNSQQLMYADKAYFASTRLLSILNDILDISRIDSNNIELNMMDCPLENIIQESVELFAIPAEEKQLKLTVMVDPSMPLELYTDQLKLGQILSNLVGNAIKFSSTGGLVTVSFKPDHFTKTNYILNIEVSDSGIGISQEQSERIFNAFTQADESTTRRFGGTGLGLAICQRLVNLLGGSISVSSALGEGAIFKLRIPITKTATPALKDLRIEKLSTLLVTDSADVIEMLQAHFKHWKIKLSVANNYTDAFATIDQLLHDNEKFVLLADLTPQNQELFLNNLATHDAAQATILQNSIVFLSASHPSTLRSSLQDLGIQAITKPLTPSRVYNTLTGLNKKVMPSSLRGSNDVLYPGLKVLSVDDVELNQDVIEGLLKPLELELHLANSAAAALEIIQQHDVDVILMDIHMEGMSGLEATQVIRKLPAIKQPLIFALSASVMEEDRKAGKQAGMDGYLTKPFHLRDFIHALKQHGINGNETEKRSIPVLPTEPTWSLPSFINEKQAMIQMNGNQQILLNCIRSFIVGFKDFNTLYAQALATQDHNKVKQLAHKLKGAALNICDAELSTLAKQQEQAQQRDSQNDADAMLHLFNNHYAELVLLLSKIPKSKGDTNAANISQDQLLVSLKEKLQQHSYISTEQRQTLDTVLSENGHSLIAQALSTALMGFDYDKALELINSIDSEANE
nr:PAS domain-containing protein [uncultured Amphritea sp.]